MPAVRWFCLLLITAGVPAMAQVTSVDPVGDEVNGAQGAPTDLPLHPIAADVQAKLGGDGEFFLHVTLVVRPEAREQFLRAMATATEGTRTESANRRYELIADVELEQRFRLCEHWTSVEGLSDHLRRPYIESLLGVFDEVLAEPLKLEIFAPVQSLVR